MLKNFLFLLCLLVGSLGISSEKYRSCCVCLFVNGFLIYFVLCIFVYKAIFICVSGKKFVTFLISLPLYVKVTHFVFWCCESLHAFCFCWREFLLTWMLLHYLLCRMFLMVYNSDSFASLVTG
jgi:hypothetical protein